MKVLLLISALICLAACQTVQKCPTDGRLMKCSIEEAPVCGILGKENIKQTFTNHCIACSIGKARFTVSGKCEDYHPESNFCSPSESKNDICTKELDHHCGHFNQKVHCLVAPCVIEASNRCQACQSSNVLYTLKGKCSQLQK